MKKSAALLIALVFLFLLSSCKKDESKTSTPFLIFKSGTAYIVNGATVPLGGVLRFGISAAGGGGIITDFRVKKTTSSGTVTMLDKGMWIETGGFDTTLIYYKGVEEWECWDFFIMTDTRDTAAISLKVFKGSGSAFGAIHTYDSITIGYPTNSQYPHFLDLNTGQAYSTSTVSGKESLIDLVSFFYISSGSPSPTLSCPGYTDIGTNYPEITSWPVRNSTSYDYISVDNNHVTPGQFFAAQNDSLLVSSFGSTTSGKCKFCLTGKVVPFKTSDAKIGLIYIIRADESADGSMEISIKIQE